jgi:hypothetical protein
MATKLYFRDTANSGSGTFPSGEQASLTSSYAGSKNGTLRTLSTTIGTTQTSSTGTTVAQTITAQTPFMAYFCSPPIDANVTISGTFGINIAVAESNTNVNLTSFHPHIYVWRPSTNALVGTLYPTTTELFFTEPAASTETVANFTNIINVTSVSALVGDVIICEIWFKHVQGMATSYTTTFYYDGTTENTTSGTTVSNHASFVEFSTNITFTGPTYTPNMMLMFM